MKISVFIAGLIMIFTMFNYTKSLSQSSDEYQYFIDVHKVGPNNITAAAAAEAHLKDLKVQDKYNVDFIKYWVNETEGHVYCLSKAHDTESIIQTHKEAHGSLPKKVYSVMQGEEKINTDENKFFLDIHEPGQDDISASSIAKAYQRKLSIQDQYNVNFINYWINEKEGKVFCLSKAKDSTSIVQIHKNVTGTSPDLVLEVIQDK